MQRQEEIDTLRSDVASALQLGESALRRIIETPTLYAMVLRGLAQAVHEHASAVLRLSSVEHVRSSKVLLRTMIESWIVARYVEADPAGQRAASYIMQEPVEAKRFLVAIRRLAIRDPREGHTALASAGLSSLEDLEDHVARLQDEIEESTRQGVPAFPKVADCAKAVGLEVMYRSVYGFLLSEQVHAGARDTLSGVLGNTADDDDLHRVLITTLFLLVQILALTGEHFGRPDRDSLRPFEERLGVVPLSS